MSNMDFFIVSGTLIKYLGNDATVTVPQGVLKIGSHAFEDQWQIEEVTLPMSVSAIGPYAFSQCRNLRSINIPPSVTEIDGSAFSLCTSLREIVLPERLETIRENTFFECTSLESVTFPKRLKIIETSAFSGCTALHPLALPGTVSKIGMIAFKGCEHLADEHGWVIVNGTVFDYFGEETAVTIPAGVQRIGGGAFFENKRLCSVHIPSHVRSVGSMAFSKCIHLKTVVLENGIQTIDREAFSQCSSLTKVTIPLSVEKVRPRAFANCPSLGVFDVTSQNTKLYDGILENCDCLRVVRLPDSISEPMRLGMSSDMVLGVFANEAEASPVVDRYVNKYKRYFLDEIFKRDQAYALKKLLSHSRKPTIDTLDDYLERAQKENCPMIKSMLLDLKAVLYSAQAIERHEGSKLNKELGLEERTLPDWRKIFRLSVQKDCVRISGYKQDDRVVEVPSMICNRPVTVLADQAFAYSDSLQTVVLPQTLTLIEGGAFACCGNLREIVIPASVSEVGCMAFAHCEELQSVTFCGMHTQVDGLAFFRSSHIVVRAPIGSEAHKQAVQSQWRFEPYGP